jgi:hypothetical protein
MSASPSSRDRRILLIHVRRFVQAEVAVALLVFTLATNANVETFVYATGRCCDMLWSEVASDSSYRLVACFGDRRMDGIGVNLSLVPPAHAFAGRAPCRQSSRYLTSKLRPVFKCLRMVLLSSAREFARFVRAQDRCFSERANAWEKRCKAMIDDGVSASRCCLVARFNLCPSNRTSFLLSLQ